MPAVNRNDRAERRLWRDETLKAVEQVRTEEAQRSEDERKAVPRQNFLLQRTRAILDLDSVAGAELKTKELWINRKIRGKTPAQNPDAPRIAPRYEAWPVEGEIPEWLRKRFADEHWLWNALALPVQHTISRIRDQQRASVSAIYKEAEASGHDTQNEQVRNKLAPKIKAALKTVDFSPLKQILTAREITLQEADLIRKGKAGDSGSEMQRLSWTVANWNFAASVANLPAWLQQIVKKRLYSTSKARRTKRDAGTGEKWFAGYPKPDPEERGGEGRLDVYFNGDNLDWSAGEIRNGYLDISSPWNPPDHRGPRTGKYRSVREMRKVTIYEPGTSANTRTKKEHKNRFSLNVLFHSVPAASRMKEYKLRAEKDATGKLRWFFIPTFELVCSAAQESRTFAGVDAGLRQSGDEEIKAVHVWKESTKEYKCFPLRAADNRWARRYDARQDILPEGERFPIQMTQTGLRDFASRKGVLLRDFKKKMGEVLTALNCLPANWERIGRRGIARMMTQEKSPEFSGLQCLRPEFDAWAKRDNELARIYRVAWGMVSENLETQRRRIARDILLGVTDVGVEAMEWKKFAEKENEGATNWERHIENVIDRNRQHSGPAKFQMVLANLARKMGKRVHWIAPAYTTMTCSACGRRNDVGRSETFTCTKCGHFWNRDENAARNLARLARECAGDDTHPLRCSRDGKSLPYHGIQATIDEEDGKEDPPR